MPSSDLHLALVSRRSNDFLGRWWWWWMRETSKGEEGGRWRAMKNRSNLLFFVSSSSQACGPLRLHRRTCSQQHSGTHRADCHLLGRVTTPHAHSECTQDDEVMPAVRIYTCPSPPFSPFFFPTLIHSYSHHIPGRFFIEHTRGHVKEWLLQSIHVIWFAVIMKNIILKKNCSQALEFYE